MKKITVTDSQKEIDAINYLAKMIEPLKNDFGGELKRANFCDREYLTIYCQDKYFDLFKCETEDKIADIIAVKRKYDYFKKKLKIEGLNAYDKELLFSAIISADLTEDKRYIIRKIRNSDIFQIDGIYNFKLRQLKVKWQEVISCLPSYFSKKQLGDFVAYLIGEKRGKKILVKDEKVYDNNYNLLERSKLLDGKGDLVREILLSSGSSVEVLSAIDEKQAIYLKNFFGRRISFLSGTLSKTVDKKI